MFVEVMEAEDSLRSLLDAGVDAFDDVDVMDLVSGLVRLGRVRDALESMALRHLSEHDVCDQTLGLKTTTWFARETGMPPRHARARVQTALRLGSMDLIEAEMGDGRFGWERAHAIGDAVNPRNTDGLAAIQNELLDLSDGATYRRFTTDLDQLARLLDPDGTEPPTTDDSRLSIRPNAAGGIHLHGDLYGDHADIVKSAIGSVADQLFRHHRHDRDITGVPIPARTHLHAQALADLCRGDATPEIRVTIPLDATTNELACDAAFRPIVISHLGEPLDIGRKSRRFTDAIRAALDTRDGGCAFAGCDRPTEHCDAHHIHHWRTGGPTSLANGLLLCRHHHRTIHRRGWTITHHHGWPLITTPDGTPLDTQRHGRQRSPTQRAPNAA